MTRFTELVGCSVPIQLAVMGGGIGTPKLAAAVSAAGGLGMLSASHPMSLEAQISMVRTLTDRPIGVGFFAFDLETRREELDWAAGQVRVVEVFWGEPQRVVVERIHSGGALSCWQVGSLDEALSAVDAGCDLVVAQGVEAGGHVRGNEPLAALLDQAVPRVAVPVIAAGGIASAAAVAEALRAGASAVRIGTRFVATPESGAHADYVSALLAASAGDTILTTGFGVDWPDAPHRVLQRSRDCAEATPDRVVGLATYGGRSWPVARWSSQPPASFITGRMDAMAMYAGTGVGEVIEVQRAADVLEQLARQLD